MYSQLLSVEKFAAEPAAAEHLAALLEGLFAGIQATRWSLDREDKTGRRNGWLRTLDRLGIGFDS